ncbi:hypothetical protein BH09MYX1_BH09MYX1_49520 [soil metagenome]
MRSRLVLFLTTLILVLGVARPAEAVPTMTTLTQLLADSPTIVIAKVHGASAAGYELDVERALRAGGVKVSGAFLVKIASSQTVPFVVGTRLVAFVGPGDTWHASAVVAAGPSLETGVLHVDSLPMCCDAHVVIPRLVTLGQLDSLIHGTPLAWTFRGKILVAGATGPMPSTIEIVATTSAASPNGVGTVTGMPTMASFPAPVVLVGGGERDVTVKWNARLSQPLRLIGVATGTNADGSIAVDYRLDTPTSMTETELRKYIADAKPGR